MRTNGGWDGYLLDSQLRQNPISFISTREYVHHYGFINNWLGGNIYWQNKSAAAVSAAILRFAPGLLDPRTSYDKGFGFSIRCLVPLAHINRGKLDKNAYV